MASKQKNEHFYKIPAYYYIFSCLSTAIKTISRNLANKKFEPEVSLLPQFLKPGSICLDVGGAYGRYALPMSRLVGPAGKVYSFEPGTYSFRVFAMAKAFHGMKNVSIIKSALSNQAGRMKLVSPLKRNGKMGVSLSYLSNHKIVNSISEDVEVTTVDIFCRQNDINPVDFIKCDVEGAEMLIFQGAKQTLVRDKPYILCEVDRANLTKFNSTPEELLLFFRQQGYNCYQYESGRLQAISQIIKAANYFFIPEKDYAPVAHKDRATVS
jgi:FkbM family methyltransferase